MKSEIKDIEIDKANKQYKDSLFRKYIRSNSAYMLELSNVLTNRNDTDISLVTDKTMVAFQVGNELIILIEHQSTINENMPFRMFLYVAEIYLQYIKSEDFYRRKLINLPVPRLFVLYNGSTGLPESLREMNLYDSFVCSPL